MPFGKCRVEDGRPSMCTNQWEVAFHQEPHKLGGGFHVQWCIEFDCVFASLYHYPFAHSIDTNSLSK